MTSFIVIEAEQDGVELRHLFQHLQYWLNGCAATGYIAVPLPVLRIKGDEGQHIDGGFKHIQTSVCADIMEAVSWITALDVQAEGFSVAVGAALVGMARDTFHICANKHGVAIFGILIQKPSLGKVRHHISCDAAMFDEIRKHSAHIFVGGRQCKWFHRFLCAFPGRGIRCSQFTAQQHCHCVRVAKAVESLHKADGMSASLLRMVIPFVASDGHAVVTGKAFFSARGKQLFTAAAQELLQIYCGGALFLFFGEMNIA